MSSIYIIIDNIKKDSKIINNLSVKELEELIKLCNHEYYYGLEPLVDDNIYDLIANQLDKKDINNKVLKEVAGNNIENKVKLPYFLGSQDKIKYDTENNKLDNWLKKYKGGYTITDKLDGISSLLEINKNKIKLYTRGDGSYGRDISHLIPHINILTTGKIKDIKQILYIRGELVISKDNYKPFENKFCHARNWISGIQSLKNPDKEQLKWIDFVSYELLNEKYDYLEQITILKSYHFILPYYKLLSVIDLDILNKIYSDRRENSEYYIDGIVIRDNNYHPINDGKTSKNPKYSFAFKMILSQQVAESKVIDIIWNVSKDGYLKPKMKIEPINLDGSVITYVTCHNAKYVVDNKLNKGSIVEIIRSGDVIPYVKDVVLSSKNPLLPNLNYKWSKNKVDFILNDMQDNQDYNNKQIIYFFQKMRLRDVSESILLKLIENGFDSISKILNIKYNDLIQLDGFQKKMSEKVINNINEIKKNDLLSIMVSCNCFGRGLAEKKLKLFLDKYPEFLEWTSIPSNLSEELCKIEGFSYNTATLLIEHIPNFYQFYEKEIKGNIYIINIQIVNKIEKNLLFTNKNIVLTGTREIENKLKELGANIKNVVNKNTDLLICKDKNQVSSKLKKALELNIKILDMNEFNKLIYS